MGDNFNTSKWKREFVYGDPLLEAKKQEMNWKRAIQDVIIELFPESEFINVHLPGDNQSEMGIVEVGINKSIGEDDLYYLEGAFDQIGLGLDMDTSPIKFDDSDGGEEIIYPELYFTYL